MTTSQDQAVGNCVFNEPVIDVGTPMVESLPSYFRRLACLHHIDCYSLLRGIARGEDSIGLSRLMRGSESHVFLYDSPQRATLVDWLERFGGPRAKRTWGFDGLNNHFVFAPAVVNHLRWCPACLCDAFDRGARVGFSAIWQFVQYAVCQTHRVRIVESCQDCGKRFLPFSSVSWTRRCVACGADQTARRDAAAKAYTGAEWALSAVVHRLFEGLECLSDGRPVTFTENVKRLIEAVGSRIGLARLVMLDHSTIHAWEHGGRPGLPAVLSLAAGFDVDPVDLVVGVVDWKGRDSPVVPEVFVRRKVCGKEELLKRVDSVFSARGVDGKQVRPPGVLCREAAVSIDFVRTHRPDLWAGALAAYQASTRSRVVERQKELSKRCKRLIAVVTAQDGPPSRYLFWRHLVAIDEPRKRQLLVEFERLKRKDAAVEAVEASAPAETAPLAGA